jgi:Endoplasmic reticulum-based factor for assembly of V-ATPase
MSSTTTTTTMTKSSGKKDINPSTTATATSSSPTYARPPLSYKKKLEGVEATPALRELWKQVLYVANSASTAAATTNETASNSTNNKNDGKNNIVHEASRRLTVEEATNIILQSKITTEKEILQQNCVPIPMIRAMEALLMSRHHVDDAHSSCDNTCQLLQQALQKSKLVHTQPPVLTEEQGKERQRFVQRMDRLQLKDEERHYNKLTANLKTRASKMADDDVTTKSMTYAASIGLNMIIAPLSFGCFMYFFAGGIFDFMGWTHLQPGSVVDIKRVIVSVISGVAMLFIEMILFVIRTHEMDKAMRHKQAKQTRLHGGAGVGAFGPYSAKTARDFKED